MLHTDAEFLNAIAAEPHERTLRLVYADWLDEHDDRARAELVRVEEEMRQTPVFADRFWELKPRRNELRTQAGAEWCGRMRYGTECEPVFTHGIPDGWAERWRLIREFTERWHRVPMPDIGGRQNEIAEAEARLGRTLPPSVREWIAFAHDLNPPDAEWLRVIRDAYTMGDVPGHAALSLLLQAEGDCHWAVRHEDMGRTDPPVYGYRGNFPLFEPGGVPAAESVSDFALGYTLDYARGEVGQFHTTVRYPERLRWELAAFPAPVRYHSEEIYESNNLRITLSPDLWSQSTRLHVSVTGPMTAEQVPRFLWSFVHDCGMCSGIFGPEMRPDWIPPRNEDDHHRAGDNPF